MDNTTHATLLALVMEAKNAAAILSTWSNAAAQLLAANLQDKANAAMAALRDASEKPEGST